MVFQDLKEEERNNKSKPYHFFTYYLALENPISLIKLQIYISLHLRVNHLNICGINSFQNTKRQILEPNLHAINIHKSWDHEQCHEVHKKTF